MTNVIESRAMSKAKPKRTAGKRRDSRGDQRRRKIFKSLHDCILAQGYVKTTLADIAAGADMSASHLLYYFNGKEAILEQYFANVSVRFLEKIEECHKYYIRNFGCRGSCGNHGAYCGAFGF